jgi:hypothetical protein
MIPPDPGDYVVTDHVVSNLAPTTWYNNYFVNPAFGYTQYKPFFDYDNAYESAPDGLSQGYLSSGRKWPNPWWNDWRSLNCNPCKEWRETYDAVRGHLVRWLPSRFSLPGVLEPDYTKVLPCLPAAPDWVVSIPLCCNPLYGWVFTDGILSNDPPKGLKTAVEDHFSCTGCPPPPYAMQLAEQAGQVQCICAHLPQQFTPCCESPRVPEVVTVGFWLMFEKTDVAAPDFRRWFSMQVNLPTAYLRKDDVSP